MARVLAIDIGTSSIRATIYGRALQPVRARPQVRYRWRVGSDGSVEAAPAAIERAVGAGDRRRADGVTHAHRRRGDRARSGTAWSASTRRDARVTSVIPWSDTRSARRRSRRLRERLDERAIHARTGCRIHSDLLAGAPALVRRPGAQDVPPRAALDVAAGLPASAAGSDAMRRACSQASGNGHVPATTTVTWDGESVPRLRRHAGSASARSSISTTRRAASAPLARRWPQLKDARWIPAVGDGALDNVGAGCTTGGRAALMIGTSGALREDVDHRHGADASRSDSGATGSIAAASSSAARSATAATSSPGCARRSGMPRRPRTTRRGSRACRPTRTA